MKSNPNLIRKLMILNDDVLGIIEVWDTWMSLFGDANEHVRTRKLALLTSPTLHTGLFFGQLHHVLVRDTVVSLARLFASTRGIVGLKALEPHMKCLGRGGSAKARTLLSLARQKHETTDAIRRQFVAHRDRRPTIPGTIPAEPPVSFQDIGMTLRLVTEFLDLFNVKLRGEKVEWHQAQGNLPLSLFVALDEAERWKKDAGYTR